MRGRLLRSVLISSPLLLGLALLPSSTAKASSASTPPNYDASSMHGNEAEDAIAINPTNPQNVVAMSTLPDVTAGLAVDVTFNGGSTWTRQVIGAGGGDLGDICCDEQLAWDRFGNLWMTYLHNVNPDTVIAVSVDGGLTFTKVASIPPVTPKGSKSPKNAEPKSNARGGNHFNDQPSIAVGANSVWVSYT